MSKKKMATDPPVSEKQRKAMYAALSGKSNLGIPKKVAEEFLGKDERIKGAGICILTPDNEALFIKRSPASNHPNEWDFPGGKADDNETPEDTAIRETREEIGAFPYGELSLLTSVEDLDGVDFITYKMRVKHKFTPKLQKEEHTEFVWASLDNPPEPLHPGVKGTVDAAKKVKLYDFDHDAKEQKKGAMDKASHGLRNNSAAALAFDRASQRSYDHNGWMHVKSTPITKANICPYFGREIPGYEELGLEPDKIYQLLRDPSELEHAVKTANNLPLLSEHVPVTLDDYEAESRKYVIGSTGTDAEWDAPYIKQSLVVWAKPDIDGIENKDKYEISCGYYYDADMTPGVYENEHYDGVMRNIRFNHAAIVEKGRAGPDVVVCDSQLNLTRGKTMKLKGKARRVKTCVMAAMGHKMAKDAAPKLDSLLSDVKRANWHYKKASVAAGIKALAKDADIEDVIELLDRLDEAEAVDYEDMPVEDTDPKIEAILAKLRGKISDEDLAEIEADLKAHSDAENDLNATDEPPEFKGKPVNPKDRESSEDGYDKEAEDEDDEDEEKGVSKAAMDAAIKLASDKAAKEATQRTIERLNGISDAKEFVRPHVGKLSITADSAEGVYKSALKVMGVDTKGIHPSAYKAIIQNMGKNSDKPRRIAEDKAPDDINKVFPDFDRIG
jgi:8-oxo-dGTP pyrophosphatase MutT (NUDIX family)